MTKIERESIYELSTSKSRVGIGESYGESDDHDGRDSV